MDRVCDLTIDAFVALLLRDLEEVPYSIYELESSFVVHVIIADDAVGVATTEEITGAVVSASGGGGFTTTVAVPYIELLATLVARTVIVCCEDTLAGAVYSPVDEILPTPGLMDQVTPLFVVPETLAVNCAL